MRHVIELMMVMVKGEMMVMVRGDDGRELLYDDGILPSASSCGPAQGMGRAFWTKCVSILAPQ